ncbi:MAG: hypothetical protein ACFE98_15085 [Candidatus Hermodarchaeota archaeon]
MSEENYQQIRQKLQESFENQEMENGLKIAMEIKEKFPKHANAAYFNLAYFQALLNLEEKMVETLEEGYKKGLWWSESSISMFPNYDQLCSNTHFNLVIKKYLDRYRKIRESTKYKWVVQIPKNYDSTNKYPVFFALHQGTSNIEETEHQWKSALEYDIILALPQSSEIVEPNKFTWLDIDSGLRDLNKIYSEIIDKYQIDLNRIFLSGSSIGGTLALEATFARPQFPVKGCIAINPSLFQPDVISRNFERARKDGVRCCILVGSKDPEYEKIKELRILLIQNKIEHNFYEIPELGHAFPENFNELLDEMLDFLLNQ